MTTPIFTFTFLPLFLLFSSTFTPITANNLISETCKKCAKKDPNLSYKFCVTSLHAANNLISETCKKCAQEEYPSMSYKFCVTSLQADPNSQGADLRQLGLISMKLVQNNVTNTRRFIKHLLKNEELDKFVRMCLDDCLDLYTDAIPSIKQAVKDYKMKDNRHANLAVSSVAGAATTCEDGFEERPGLVSPLTKRNNEMFQLCDIALMIINMVSSSFY